MLSHRRPGAGGGLAGSGQGRQAEQADLGGQRLGVYVVPAVVDRLTYKLLYRSKRLSALRGPAPLASRCGIGDGLQLTQRVRAAD